MSMKINHELPLPEVLKNEYPLSPELKAVKQRRDEEIRRIFTGESDKFVVLVGLVPQTMKILSVNMFVVSRRFLTRFPIS